MNWDVTYYPEYWNGKKLAYPEVPREHAKFAQSITVGNLVFASGCTGVGAPADDIAAQVTAALDKTRAALETAGSSMENIVKTFFMVRSLDDYQLVRKTETEYYERHAPKLVETPPAATLMVIGALAKPEYRVEYEAIAAIDRTAPDWGVTYYPEFWAGKELAYPHVPKDHAKFARTQVVGNLVVVSGCQALDHDSVRVETADFREQSRLVLEKIKIGMEETGGSLSSVVKTNVFLKDVDLISVYREVEREFFQQHDPQAAANPPASTVYVCVELPRPEFLIEVEAFGVADTAAPGWDSVFYAGNKEASSVVRAGNLLFLSGCDGTDPASGKVTSDAVADQVRTALDKVRTAMEEAGSSLEKLVKITLMLKNIEDYPAMRRAECEYYEQHAPHLLAHPPACTFIQMPEITGGGTLFQIDATGVL
ncbi:MAG: hypothetical protein ISR52_06625 [Rhodospirillales bacterium]|nr:hypothetical protein [Rhodospirillales bacterium]